jgi:hypothetical protein
VRAFPSSATCSYQALPLPPSPLPLAPFYKLVALSCHLVLLRHSPPQGLFSGAVATGLRDAPFSSIYLTLYRFLNPIGLRASSCVYVCE